MCPNIIKGNVSRCHAHECSAGSVAPAPSVHLGFFAELSRSTPPLLSRATPATTASNRCSEPSMPSTRIKHTETRQQVPGAHSCACGARRAAAWWLGADSEKCRVPPRHVCVSYAVSPCVHVLDSFLTSIGTQKGAGRGGAGHLNGANVGERGPAHAIPREERGARMHARGERAESDMWHEWLVR